MDSRDESALRALPERVRRFLPTRTEAYVGFGLALYLAWVDFTFHSSQVISVPGSPFPPLDVNRLVFFISIATLCLVLAACAVFDRAADRFLYRPATLRVAPAAMSVSTLLILGTSAQGPAGTAFIVLAGVSTAASSAICLFHWGELSNNLSTREVVWAAAVGFTLSSLFSVLYHLLAKAGFAAAPFATGVLLVVVDAALPLAAGAVLTGFVERERIALGPPWRGAAEDPGAVADANAGDGAVKALVGRHAAALVIIGLSISLCRDLSFMEGGQSPTGGNPEVQLGIALIVFAASLFVVGTFLSENPRRKVGGALRLLILLAVAGVCVMPVFTLFGGGFVSLRMTSAVSIGSLTCCYIIMWITTSGICRKYRAKTTRYFAWTRVAWTLGPILGSALAMAVAQAPGEARPLYTYCCTALCVVLLFALHAFVFTEHTLNEALSIAPKRYRRPFKDRCADVARAFGLTEREAEVMMLFARGRDSAFIQGSLNLSKSTVSTHRQHIYEKLDIHSQQELLDKLAENNVPV